MNGVERTSVQINLLKIYFCSIMYISLPCLICRPVVMMFQKFSPIFSCAINWWYIWFICSTDQIFRSGLILNWWNINITICFNIMQSRIFMCRSGFKSNLFNDLLSKLDIRFVLFRYIEFPGKYFEGWYWLLILLKEIFGQHY